MQVRVFTSIITVFVVLLVFDGAVSATGKKDRLGTLIANADAIVAVRILTTDYRATAIDGPMIGDAKVLKVIKGQITDGAVLRFGETGWWEPTYRADELRILFLRRVTRQDPGFPPYQWHTLPSDFTDFFFTLDSLEALSPHSLSAFLSEVQEAAQVSPEIEVSKNSGPPVTFSVKFINKSNRPIWVNPSRVDVPLDSNKGYCRGILQFGDQVNDTWSQIPPDGSVTGTVRIVDRELETENPVFRYIGNRAVCFPKRCWSGRAIPAAKGAKQ